MTPSLREALRALLHEYAMVEDRWADNPAAQRARAALEAPDEGRDWKAEVEEAEAAFAKIFSICLPLTGTADSTTVGMVRRLAEKYRALAAPASPEPRPLVTWDKRAADALAVEVEKLIERKVIDSRDPVADALLDYRDGKIQGPHLSAASPEPREPDLSWSCPACEDLCWAQLSERNVKVGLHCWCPTHIKALGLGPNVPVSAASPEPEGERGERIRIRPSPTADTRTCDWSKVSKETLYQSSVQHIADVAAGMRFFAAKLDEAARLHDHDKLSAIDRFHADFRTGFKETGWWDNHRKVNRHHLTQNDGIPADVNLIDVLDHIVDCVMAGMARSGSVLPLSLPPEVLARAFQGTVALLQAQVVVEVAPAAPPSPAPEAACSVQQKGTGRCLGCGTTVEPMPCHCGAMHVGVYCWPCHHKNVGPDRCAAPHCPEHGYLAAKAYLESRALSPAPRLTREQVEETLRQGAEAARAGAHYRRNGEDPSPAPRMPPGADVSLDFTCSACKNPLHGDDPCPPMPSGAAPSPAPEAAPERCPNCEALGAPREGMPGWWTCRSPVCSKTWQGRAPSPAADARKGEEK